MNSIEDDFEEILVITHIGEFRHAFLSALMSLKQLKVQHSGSANQDMFCT